MISFCHASTAGADPGSGQDLGTAGQRLRGGARTRRSAGLLAEESPALRDLVDELEPASALVLPIGFAPVREPDPAVSMTSTCTTEPRRIITTVTLSALVACCTAFVTSSQVSSSASNAAGCRPGGPYELRATGTSSARRAKLRVAAAGVALGRASQTVRIGDSEGRTRHIASASCAATVRTINVTLR